jgi:Bacteriophage baseplate protein W
VQSMNAITGKPVDDITHLEQSIRDILTTPIGTRVMRRDYGSRIPALVDQPINQLLTGKMQAAIASALAKYEPRVSFSGIVVDSTLEGKINVSLHGYYLAENRVITFTNIEI